MPFRCGIRTSFSDVSPPHMKKRVVRTASGPIWLRCPSARAAVGGAYALGDSARDGIPAMFCLPDACVGEFPTLNYIRTDGQPPSADVPRNTANPRGFAGLSEGVRRRSGEGRVRRVGSLLPGQRDVQLEDLAAAVAIEVHGHAGEIDLLVTRDDGEELLLQLRQVVHGARARPAGALARHDDRQPVFRERSRLLTLPEVIEERHG